MTKTLGHVLGYITLTLLLTAGAAQSLAGSNTVFSDDIVDGTITHADVKPNSLGGSRFLDNSVTSGKILDGTILSQDLKAGTIPTILTARVRGYGDQWTVSGRGVVSVAFAPEGLDNSFKVTFNQDVSGCTYVATGAGPNETGNTPSVWPGASNDSVRVYLTTGNSNDPFNLVVVC